VRSGEESSRSVHVRVCPDCGEEYRPEIVTCADCGATLEDRFLEDGQTPDAPPPAPAAPAPAGPDLAQHRPIFSSAQARDLVPFAEALKQAGIAFHFLETPADEEGRGASYSLLVHETDEAAAQRSLTSLLHDGEEPHAVESLQAQFEEGRGYVRCPACGQEQAAGALECPECGLAFGVEGE
jgi:ribosomal protein L32